VVEMHNITVNLSQNSYMIKIGTGILAQTGDSLRSLGMRNKAVIVTNPLVKNLYGDGLNTHLMKAGFKTAVLEVPDGEEYKSLEQAGRLFDRMSEFGAERSTPVIALGGGVIGDLTGFVAATYMRGIPLIQLPTTLLAQVDSSIGGKTAVNHGKLKNMIGAFYQPKIVLTDISTLKTLSQAEVVNGLAEVIKYGIISDRGLFQLIADNIEKLKLTDMAVTEEVVARCMDVKARVVEKDERDEGWRNILNYGHTIGHAVETVSDFKIKHGHGVAIGMVGAGMIAQRAGLLSASELERIISLITAAGLPIKIPDLDIELIMQAMRHDKKKIEGKIRFILPQHIGEVLIRDDISMTLVQEVLRDLGK
jgi:3-dehydroquinate synthase